MPPRQPACPSARSVAGGSRGSGAVWQVGAVPVQSGRARGFVPGGCAPSPVAVSALSIRAGAMSCGAGAARAGAASPSVAGSSLARVLAWGCWAESH